MSLRTKIKLQNDEGVRTYEESQKRGLGRLFAGGLAVGASLITRDLAKKTTGKTAEVVCSSTATGLLSYVILDTALSCVTFPVALTKFSKKKSVAGAYFKNYDNCTGWSIVTDEQGNEIRKYDPDKDNRIVLYSSKPEDQEKAYNYLKAENKIKGFHEVFKDQHANLLKRIYVDYVDADDEETFAACRKALSEAGITASVQKIIQDDVAKNGVVTKKSMKFVEHGARKVLDKIACWDFCQEIQKNAKNEYSKFESLDHLKGSLYLTPEQIKIFDKKGGKLSNGRFLGINKFPFTEEQYKLLVSYKGGSIKDLERIEVLRRKIFKEQEKNVVNQKVVNDAVAEIDDIQKRIIHAASSHRKRLRVPFTNSGSTPFVVGKKFRVLNGTVGQRLQKRSARKKAAKNTTEALEASFSNNIFPITKVLSRPLAGGLNYIQKRLRYGKLYSKHKQIFGHNGFEARHKGMHAADVWCDTSSRFDKTEKKYMKLGLTDVVKESNQGEISNMAVAYVKESAKAKLASMTTGIVSAIASVKERANNRTDKMRHGTTTYLDNPVMVQVYLDGDSNDKKVLASATLNIDHDDVLEGAMQGLIEDVKNGNIQASEINNISFMSGDRKVVVYREQLNKVWADAKKGVPYKDTRLAKSLAQICTKEKFPKVIDIEEYESWIKNPKASQTASVDVESKLDPDSSLGAVNPNFIDGEITENPVSSPNVDKTPEVKPVADPFVIDYQYGQTGNVDNVNFVVSDNKSKQNVDETPEVAEQLEIDVENVQNVKPALSKSEQIAKERELLKDAEQLEIDIDEAIRKNNSVKNDENNSSKIPTNTFSKYNRMAVDVNKSRNDLYAKIDKLNKDYEAAMALLNEARESGKANEIQLAKDNALDIVRDLKTSYITIHNLYQAKKEASDKNIIRQLDDIIADLSEDFNRLLAIEVNVDEAEINNAANSSIDAEISKIEEDLESANQLLTNAEGKERVELLEEKQHYLAMLISLNETKLEFTAYGEKAKVKATRKSYQAELKAVEAELSSIKNPKNEKVLETAADNDDRKVDFIDRMADQPIGRINNEDKKVVSSVDTSNNKAKSTKPAIFVFGAIDDEDSKPANKPSANGTQSNPGANAGNKASNSSTNSTSGSNGKMVNQTVSVVVANNVGNVTVAPTVKPASQNSTFDRLEKKVKAIEKKCNTITKRITNFETVSLPKLKAINDEVEANNRYAFTISERERKVESAREELTTTSEFMKDAQAIIDKIKGKTLNELTDEERNAEAIAYEVAKKTSKTMSGVNRETINDKKEIQSAISESKDLGIKPKKSKAGASKTQNSVS